MLVRSDVFFFRYISDTSSHICQTFETGESLARSRLPHCCPTVVQWGWSQPARCQSQRMGLMGFWHQLRHARRQGSVQLLLLGVEAEEQVDLGQCLILIGKARAQTSEKFWNVAVADGDYFLEPEVLNGRMRRLNWIPLVLLVSSWPLLMPEPGCQVQYSELPSRTLSFLQEEALTMHFTIWPLS